MDILEQKIDALLGSPVGCAFVLGVECNSPLEQLPALWPVFNWLPTALIFAT